MADPRVLFLGQDLYAKGLVLKLPDTIERKTFQRDKLIVNNYNIECENINNFFSADNAASILNNINWVYNSIQVYNEDNNLIWDGIVTDIRRNHRTKKATIETKDKLFQLRKRTISYESSDWETAADAAKNIMDAEGFTAYDSSTIAMSADVLSSSTLKCNFNKSDNITMFQALEKLGAYSCSDVYSHDNKIYFKAWTPFTGGVSINIAEKDLKSAPIVSSLEKELINDYNIGYNGDGGTPATDSANNNIAGTSRTRYETLSLPELRSDSTNNQLYFENLASAVYVGEAYIRRGHYNLNTTPRPLNKIQFDLDIKFRSFITLNTFFRLTFSDESWSNKIFEIFEFRRSLDRRNINVVAYEIDENA